MVSSVDPPTPHCLPFSMDMQCELTQPNSLPFRWQVVNLAAPSFLFTPSLGRVLQIIQPAVCYFDLLLSVWHTLIPFLQDAQVCHRLSNLLLSPDLLFQHPFVGFSESERFLVVGYMAHQYCEISPIYYVSHPQYHCMALVPILRGGDSFGHFSAYCWHARDSTPWGYIVSYSLWKAGKIYAIPEITSLTVFK
jgi:hypothetical protein